MTTARPIAAVLYPNRSPLFWRSHAVIMTITANRVERGIAHLDHYEMCNRVRRHVPLSIRHSMCDRAR